MELLRCPSDQVKHKGAALSGLRNNCLFERNSSAAGQQFPRFEKSDSFRFLDKSEHIPALAARPAFVALPARIDVEGGPLIVVEGTEPFEGGAGLAQGYIRTDDVHDVVGLLDPLREGYPVIRQGAPGGQKHNQAGRGATQDLLIFMMKPKSLGAVEASCSHREEAAFVRE
jgi:hypothetical protein